MSDMKIKVILEEANVNKDFFTSNRKENNLKCPFCQQELHKDSDGYYTCYTDNCDCWANGGNGASGSESLWLTLITIKKKLDACISGLDQMTWGCDNTDAEYLLKEIKEITALEQKD